MPPLGDMSLRTGGGESKIANAFRFCGGAYGLLTSKPRLARTSVDERCQSISGVFCGMVSLGEFERTQCDILSARYLSFATAFGAQAEGALS